MSCTPTWSISSLQAHYQPDVRTAQISLRHDPTSAAPRTPRGCYLRFPAPASSMRTARAKRTQKTQLFRILPYRYSVGHFQKNNNRPHPRTATKAAAHERATPGKYSEIQPIHEFTCPHCGTFSLSMTILSVNLLKNRFTVEWAHFHAHDSPTGQSRQRLRGHTRHGDTTSPDHPRGHRAGHRGRRHRSVPAEQDPGLVDS